MQRLGGEVLVSVSADRSDLERPVQLVQRRRAKCFVRRRAQRQQGRGADAQADPGTEVVGRPVHKECVGGRTAILALEPIPVEVAHDVEARRGEELDALGDVVDVLHEKAGLPLRAAGVATNQGGGGDRHRVQVLVRSAFDLAQVRAEQQAMRAEGGKPADRPRQAEPLVLGRYSLHCRERLLAARRTGRRIGQDPRPLLFEVLRVAEQTEVQPVRVAGAQRTAEDELASVHGSGGELRPSVLALGKEATPSEELEPGKGRQLDAPRGGAMVRGGMTIDRSPHRLGRDEVTVSG